MRLRKFRVKAYRCIHDSGEITVGDLAAFIGRNESGKTTILHALTLLNKDEQVSQLDLCDEMDEELKNEIRLAEGEFELNQHETDIIKEKFPGLPNIKRMKIFRTNKNPQIQYEFEDIKINEDKNKGIDSWGNFSKQIFEFLDTIPNHLRININTKFFEETVPKNQEIFDNGMAEINNQLQIIANQEHKVVEEWEKIYTNPQNQFLNLLSGKNEKKNIRKFYRIRITSKICLFFRL